MNPYRMSFGWVRNETLLDTHIFIWWADQSGRLSPAALSALEDQANELLGVWRAFGKADQDSIG
jgi:hypothetical protein